MEMTISQLLVRQMHQIHVYSGRFVLTASDTVEGTACNLFHTFLRVLCSRRQCDCISLSADQLASRKSVNGRKM